MIQLCNSTKDSPAAAPYICILDLRSPGKKNAFYYSVLKKHGIFTSFLTTKMYNEIINVFRGTQYAYEGEIL